ncbi:hypothetical protein [Schlesneria paludicola]|uniref:hypothetical protein n=1 Tax=Schlesneria paludicola TaxID=360056 RepID=UPI00029A3359|nr:hypothetical protein [Schlesneria paludicola]
MNNSPNDPKLREFYETFSTDHHRQLEALMQTISELEPTLVPKPNTQPRRDSSRNSRRALVGLVAAIVVGLSLPLMSSVFETKPASTLADGWRHEFRVSSDKTPVAVGDDRHAMLEVWTEEGWLIACRKSFQGDVEWQVVLARTDVAEEPKIAQTPDELTVTFGPYLIRDASTGNLHIRRQPKKASDQWPELELQAGKPMASSGNWRGFKLAASTIGDWIWVTSGPSDPKNGDHHDVWLRAEQQMQKRAGYGSSGGMLSAQVFIGNRKANDDGKQFTANRVMTADVVRVPQGL